MLFLSFSKQENPIKLGIYYVRITTFITVYDNNALYTQVFTVIREMWRNIKKNKNKNKY